MPIRKLTESQAWIDEPLVSKTEGLESDVWSDATRIASRLLFIDKVDPKEAERRIVNQFRTSKEEAQAVIKATLEAEAEPITIWNPTVRGKIAKSNTNMQLVRAGLINEIHCTTDQGLTVTAAKNEYGETYTIMSAYQPDEAVAELTPYFNEVLGNDYDVVVFSANDLYKGFEEWLAGVGQYYSSMGFSHNLLRGVADEITPELSTDLFDEGNNRRPFSQ